MVHYAVFWAGLLLAGVVLFPVSVGIFPLVTAIVVARNRWKHAAMVLAAAGFTPLASVSLYWLVVTRGGTTETPDTWFADPVRFTVGSTLEHIAFLFAGAIAGLGIARLWSYGRLVHVLTGYVFVLMTVSMLMSLGAWESEVSAIAEYFRTAFHQQAERTGTESLQTQLDLISWAEEHAASLVLGVNYATIFVASCVFVSLTRYILRRWYGEGGPVGSFVQMRPSEWLVWLAILVALLCLAYQRWPKPELSFVAWNGALGLSAVYCVNGLSILLYGVYAFRPNLLIFALIVFILINVGAVPMLMLLGLFDTWGDYRRRIDKLVAARQARDRSGDDGV